MVRWSGIVCVGRKNGLKGGVFGNYRDWDFRLSTVVIWSLATRLFRLEEFSGELDETRYVEDVVRYVVLQVSTLFEV